jgi:hypothetical protein
MKIRNRSRTSDTGFNCCGLGVGGGDGLGLVEADRGQGDDGHAQGIQQAPALKDPVADHAVARDRYQQQERQAEPDEDPVPWRRPGNPEAARSTRRMLTVGCGRVDRHEHLTTPSAGGQQRQGS